MTANLPPRILSVPAVILALAASPRVAEAQCFSSLGSVLWPNGEVVVEFDRTAMTSVAMGSCLDDSVRWEYEAYAALYGVDTIQQWVEAGLDDWLYGDPDIEQPLTWRERVGDEEPYILVTSWCDLGNRVSRSGALPGRDGEDTYYINLRPTTHDLTRFEQTVRHELGHAFGMQHAQERPGRDHYVDVHEDALAMEGYGQKGAGFCKYTMYNLPFEYDSIMMYPLMARGEGLTCEKADTSGCAMLPVAGPDFDTHVDEMENRTITEADRWALRLHYAWRQPERLGLYNPITSQFAFAAISYSAANPHAYSTAYQYDEPYLSVSDYNGVFDRSVSSSTATMFAGDWTDPVDGGFDQVGVAWLERSGRAYDLRFELDLDEDMWGEDEVDDSLGEGGERIVFTGDFDGDPATAPGLAVYDPAMDSFAYDGDGDGTLETEVWGFYSSMGSPWPVAADPLDQGYDSLCVFFREWGTYVCDTDGDDVADAGTWFTSTTGDDVYPLAGDWNGDGVDELGVYVAGSRTWELDRNRDYVIEQPDAYGLSIDLVIRAGSAPVGPDDIELRPFAGTFAPGDLQRVVYNDPWKDHWCDTFDGVEVCGDAWDSCMALSEVLYSEASGPACHDPLEGTYDELPGNCWWAGAIVECVTP